MLILRFIEGLRRSEEQKFSAEGDVMFVLRIAAAGLLAVATGLSAGTLTSSGAQARSRPVLAECVNPHTGALAGSSFCNCRLAWNATHHNYWIRHSAAFCSNYRSQTTASIGRNRELGVAPRTPDTGSITSGAGATGTMSGGAGNGGISGAAVGASGGEATSDSGGGGVPTTDNDAGNPGNDNMVGNAGENPNGKFTGDNPGQGNSGDHHTH
jgi:hypothetical protein